MTAWEEYLAQVKVSPGDIVDMHGLPVVLDLKNRPAGYKPGTYRCQPCGRDPYDLKCCRQSPPCRSCGTHVRWLDNQWTASDGSTGCSVPAGPRPWPLPPAPPFVPHEPKEAHPMTLPGCPCTEEEDEECE